MSKEKEIQKGLLSDKMSSYRVEPPGDSWDNISSRIHKGGSKRMLLVVLSAAAGLALAITIGLQFIDISSELPVNEQAMTDQGVEPAPEQHSEPGRAMDQEDASMLAEDDGERSKPEENNIVRPSSRFEEKVLIALEEVIEEKGETVDKEIVEEELAVYTEEDQRQDNVQQEGGEQDVMETHEKDGGETQVESNQDASTELQLSDSSNAQRYLDSLSNELIPDKDDPLDEESEIQRWQLGAAVSPLYSYRNASSADQTQNMAANNSESGLLTYSGGIQVRYAQSERLTFESGIYYNRMGLAIGEFNVFRSEMDYMFGPDYYTDNSIVSMSNSIGRISTNSADVVVNAWSGAETEKYGSLESQDIVTREGVVSSFVQSLEYLEVPFNLKYKIINRELKVLLIGGVSTNLLVGNKVLANTGDGRIEYGDIHDIKSVNYSGNAGLGFVYEFSRNLSLSLEPRFKYYLNSVNSTYLPVTRPYALGLYTGINYTF